MPRQKRGSTLRAQWLGDMLRRERERAGIKHKQAGLEIQRDGSTVSRIEAGISPARTGDVVVLMRLYRTPAKMRPVLEQLSKEIWETGWWESYADDVAGSFIDHAWLEDRAERIDWFETSVIPGLFQTKEYAHEAIVSAAPDAPAHQIDKWLSYRLERKRVLGKENPPTITAVLDEAAIRRRVGGKKTMRDQLSDLLELAQRPNITILVIPFEAGMHASPDGSFTIIQLPDPFPPVAHVQSPGGAVYLEHDKVEPLIAAFARLGRVARSPEKSTDLIEQVIHDDLS